MKNNETVCVGIDWKWYDEMVREYDEQVKNYVEPLLDLNFCDTKKEIKKLSEDDKLLMELFSNP